MRALTILALAAALVAIAETAEAADVAACLAASEAGQRARAAGKLREARDQFIVCGDESCPAVVRRDCTQWTSELAPVLPTIVFGARDASGRDLFDVTVSMDGVVLVKKLDGKSVPVDPGPHTFRFEHAGFPPVSQRLLVKEGERARVLNVMFEGGASPTKASAATPSGASDAAAPVGEQRSHTVFPWLVVGAGVVTASIGLVFIATAPDHPGNCNPETGKCTKLSGQSDADFKNDQETAGRADSQPVMGGFVAAAGAALIVGGLVWHLLEPTGPRESARPRVVPWTTGRAGGVALGGSF